MGFEITKEAMQEFMAGNTIEKHLGEEGGASPMMDLVARLSQQLNQQTAESNLYKGGAGYGGSFMNKDQLAARARGETLGAKPYGGWGGYGSLNRTMTNNVTQPQPGDDPITGGGVVPVGGGGGSTGGGGSIPTGGGGGGTGGGAAPIGGGGATGGSAQVPIGGGTTMTPVHSSPAPNNGGGMTMTVPPNSAPVGQSSPYAAFAQGAQAPTTWGGNLKPGDPGWNPAWVGGGPSGGFGSADGGYTRPPTQGSPGAQGAQAPGQSNAMATTPARTPGLQEYTDPNVQQIYEALVAKGMRVDATIDSDSIRAMIAQGASPGLILKNYSAVMDRLGPNAFSAMHGQLGAMNGNVEDLTNGKWLQGTLANAGVDPGPLTPMGGLNTPMPTVGGGSAAVAGGENSSATAPTSGSGSGAQAPGDSAGDIKDPNKPVYGPGSGGPPLLPNTDTGIPSKGMNNQRDGWLVPGDPDYDKKKVAGAIVQAEFTPGKDWGVQPNPPKGMAPGDTYTLPNGTKQVMTADGRYSSWYVDDEGKAQYGWMVDGLGGEMLNLDPAQRPNVGTHQIIGYDENKNPIYNDNGMFEQGDNASGVGDITPDSWSNSPDWRPEEPTGGIYGAFTDLASGRMTDYENQIGESWRNMANNPATADDEDYKRLVAEYNKTPGKGIDEAYGAYNDMINSQGYSDAEKGAIAGSAVRGANQGFQRSADDMRRQAARTGNANSAYAAMASMGSQYGQNLGELNRQNQIKFADETQRRHETGAQGMTNVAGLANTKAQFGLGAAGDYAKEMARRREAATKGMGDYATFGRGLQSQGIAGLQGMLKDTEAAKQNTYSQIAQLLGTSMGTVTSGRKNSTSSSTSMSERV